MPSELSEEDQARVDRYLQTPQRQQQRSARNLWWVLLGLWGLLFVLGGVSYTLARYYGVV